MNCPKCGFVQEERADCRKCGVVIAKFLALRAQEVPLAGEIQEPLPAPNGSHEEHFVSDTASLLEIRQTVKNLQQRFNEMEFDRAERRRFRGELRALDLQVQDGLGKLTSRQDELEQRTSRLAEHPPAPTLQDFAALKLEVRNLDAASVLRRLERFESRLQALSEDLAGKADARQLAPLQALDARLKETENHIGTLTAASGASLGENTAAQLTAALSSFDDLRSALQGVTVRYSEIGELKKNHLVLRDMVESLQNTAEKSKREGTNGSAGRAADLEKEVSALKAEVRSAYERMESLERAAPTADAAPTAGEDLGELKKSLAAAIENRAEDHQWMESELAAMGAIVKECVDALEHLPQGIGSWADQIHRLDKLYQPLLPTLDKISREAYETSQKVVDLGKDNAAFQEALQHSRNRIQSLEDKLQSAHPVPPPGEPDEPVEMHSIRQNLDEIRSFMAALSRKL